MKLQLAVVLLTQHNSGSLVALDQMHRAMLQSLLDGGDATPLELCRSEHIALQDATWNRAVRTRAYNHFTHPFR